MLSDMCTTVEYNGFTVSPSIKQTLVILTSLTHLFTDGQIL